MGQSFLHAHELPQSNFAKLAPRPVQSAAHAPPPHFTSPPWHAPTPPQCVVHGAALGHVRRMPLHAPVPLQSIVHEAVESQSTFTALQEPVPTQSTKQRIEGGQLMVRSPQAERAPQLMWH